MRCLNRNKMPFYHASFERLEPTYDEYGNESGHRAIYGLPVSENGNISPAQGETLLRVFGDDEGYDRVLMLDKQPQTPINEQSVLWVDRLPVLNEDGSTVTPWDYIVKKVARSINCIAIAIRKVDVNE